MMAGRVRISIDSALLKEVDHLVKTRAFSSRSQAIQAAVKKTLTSRDSNRLATESAKLGKTQEQMLADEGLRTIL